VRSSDSGRYTLISCAAAAMLAGCGGSQPPIGAPGAAPQSRAVAMHAARGKSWMLPEAKSEDLIYATFGCGGTCVLSYPAGKLVGALNVGDAGACADKSGNVYIPNQNNLFEYSHGGAAPINTYTVPNAEVTSCSVDTATSNVATTVNDNSGSNYSVAVFSSPNSSPMTYLIEGGASACGYDNEGNLFVDEPGSHVMLYELPKQGDEFDSISIEPSLEGNPGQLQWDGKYMALEGLGVSYGVKLYRLQISGSSATVVHTIKFKGITRSASLSWIEGNSILIPYGIRGDGPRKTRIGIWKYPVGGKPLQVISNFAQGANLQAVTFSPASP